MICLSETRPPHPGDKNEIAPAGVMAIKYCNQICIIVFVIRQGLGPCSQITRSSYKNFWAVYYAATFFEASFERFHALVLHSHCVI